MKAIKSGVMPACMTIWNSDESYNAKAQEKYLRWLIDKGVTSLSICGSTGENITMLFDEQKEIIEHICKFIGGEVPIYAGTGRYGTKQTIEMSQFAEKQGAEGCMVILPFYLKPHKRAAMNHFRNLRKELGIDIMVYNNPWFAGYEFDAKEVDTLFREGVIASIKCAHGDVNRVHDLKNTTPDLTVMYGHDYAPMEAFFGGADGWLSGLPAVFPRFTRMLYDTCVVEKDVVKGQKLWAKMKPFIDYFYTYTTGDPHWQEIFKYVLKCQGLDDAGLPRLPLGEVSAEEKKNIDKIMQDVSEVL